MLGVFKLKAIFFYVMKMGEIIFFFFSDHCISFYFGSFFKKINTVSCNKKTTHFFSFHIFWCSRIIVINKILGNFFLVTMIRCNILLIAEFFFYWSFAISLLLIRTTWKLRWKFAMSHSVCTKLLCTPIVSV